MAKRELIPSRGAVAQPLMMEVLRELTPADLNRLSEAPKSGVPVLQKLKTIHHRQAQLIAQGKPHKEVAIILGCTVGRLVQLMNDPTFIELVAYYSDQINVTAIEDAQRVQAKLVDVGEMAIDELQDRLEDDTRRNKMSVTDLRQVAEFAMDRTIAPPKAAPNTPVPPAQVTINFGTALRPVEKTIEGEFRAEGEQNIEQKPVLTSEPRRGEPGFKSRTEITSEPQASGTSSREQIAYPTSDKDRKEDQK